MIDEGVYEEYAAALEAASDLASKAVIELEREIGHLTGDDLAQALAASYASIVGEYGQVAAEAALEFYASVRSAAGAEQGYDPVPAQGRSVEALSRDVGVAIASVQAALPDVLRSLGGMAIRRTMEQASDTIIENARSDKAHPRWAIVPRMGACSWCIMLGSQGFVYSTDKTATSARHPWCKCVTVVDFDAANPSLKGYDEGGMYDRYRSCRAAIEQDAERRWDAMGDAERARYGGNGRSDYDHYLRNRIVAEMNTRDREWLRTGRAVSTDYSMNPKARYGTLKRENDFSRENIVNKGNEWRDLWVHHVLEQNGLRAIAQDSGKLDLMIGNQWWKVKSPMVQGDATDEVSELGFIESNIKKAARQFKKRGIEDVRIIFNSRYRTGLSDDVVLREIRAQMEKRSISEVVYINRDGNLIRLTK